MFSLYGISGPIFQGPFEALSRLPPVVRRRPVGAVRRVDDSTATPQLASAAPPAARPAVDAYQAMLPENLDRGPLYHAHQIMQNEVISVRSNADVAQAWRTLVEHRIHQAPVLDETETLVGIVSERNLLTAFNVDETGIRDVLFRRVRDVMTSPVVAAAPHTDLRHIARVMLERDVEGVPVVSEQGRLLGFISRSDILAAIVNEPPLSLWR